MSDPIKAQRTASPSAYEPPSDDGTVRAEPGVAIRLDAAHTPLAAEAAEAAAETIAASARRYKNSAGAAIGLASPEAHDVGDEPSEPNPLQVAQIVEHLKVQHAELDRREQRLQVQMAQLDQERRDTRMWAAETDASLQEREFGISRQEATLAQRADSCLKLESELKGLHESLLRERQSLNAEREQFVIDREQDRQALEEWQVQQRREIERRHHDFLAEQEQLRLQIQQERVLLDSRHRFQQDHLHKSMQEFEVAQAEFRREQQTGRMRLEQIESQTLLRSRQLARLRELIDEQQRSVERERDVLTKERKSFDERLRLDREQLREERESWEQERDIQRADLRRQQDMLALHAENLESRRQRLDRLRGELEETNRQTLEMRLTVEESCAQLMQTAGADVTKQRIEEARSVLAEYYRHTRDSLIQQRQELEQWHLRQQQHQEEFRNERQALVEWVSRQEQQFAEREQALAHELQSLETREQTWRAAADRWTQEKLQAESVIRDLLRQLAEHEGAEPR